MSDLDPAQRVKFLREKLPAQGFFAEKEWRVSPSPFPLNPSLVEELEGLGRMLLQFNRAANLLYRQSIEGKQPAWVAKWLDQGKPAEIIELQRSSVFKNELPRVLRPDILLTETGFVIVELDSVPGGIGLTSWFNQTYSELGDSVVGGKEGMIRGFSSIFADSPRVHIVVSNESATYAPEMEWLSSQYSDSRFKVRDQNFKDFQENDLVYRFFELFDLANLPNAERIFSLAKEKRLKLTPPPKAFLEEKMQLALFWNKNLREFWRKELSEKIFLQLQKYIPYGWVMDPTPLPPHAAIPELNLARWEELKSLSQKERELILKVSGYSELAWGSRGVYLGSDLSKEEWSKVVDQTLANFSQSPSILQRFHKPKSLECQWYDEGTRTLHTMQGRARLCPYYFVTGEHEKMRTELGGILASICPADKKLIHGMKDAVMTCCSVEITQ